MASKGDFFGIRDTYSGSDFFYFGLDRNLEKIPSEEPRKSLNPGDQDLDFKIPSGKSRGSLSQDRDNFVILRFSDHWESRFGTFESRDLNPGIRNFSGIFQGFYPRAQDFFVGQGFFRESGIFSF